MNDTLASLLLGIIEGITEFLPISSTGHLLIAEHWLGARSDLFNIAIQAGAILAVVLIYRARLLELVLGLGQARNRTYALKLALAFGVTAVLGLLVKKLGVELPETLAPIAWALLIGGFAILAIEAIDARRPDLPDNDPDAISWGTAALVGLAQVLAGVFPGTSRSAAAIFAALLFGRSSRVAATEFAFLVGIPTMFAATAYELLRVLKDGGAAGEDWTGLGIAFVASAITAFVAVKWLLGYIQTHRFTVFAWYRIVLGAALLAWSSGIGSAAAAVATPSPQPSVAASPVPVRMPAATRPSNTLPGPAPMADVNRGERARTVAAEEAAREYETLKLCVDAAAFREAWKDPETRKRWDAFSRGEFPPYLTEDFRKLATEELDYKLDAMHRAEAACAGVGERAEDGSIYAVARRAAELGDRTAALCYLMTPWPMSEARWNSGSDRVDYLAAAPGLIDAGVAAGDDRMLMLALTAAYSSNDGPEAELASRKPGHAPYQPWKGNGLGWLMSIWPAGDVDRFATLRYLQLAGQDDAEARRTQASKLDDFVRARMTPAQARQAKARGESLYRRAFGSGFRKQERPASDRCSY